MHVHVVHINAFRIFSYSSTAQLWSLYRRLLVRKWSNRFQQMLQQSDRGPTWHRHNSQPYHRLHNIEDTHTEPWKNISGARVIWLCSCSRVTQVAQSKCLHAPWRHIILGVLWHFIPTLPSALRPPNSSVTIRWLLMFLHLQNSLLTLYVFIFNERAARRSRSTSRFGCLFDCVCA